MDKYKNLKCRIKEADDWEPTVKIFLQSWNRMIWSGWDLGSRHGEITQIWKPWAKWKELWEEATGRARAWFSGLGERMEHECVTQLESLGGGKLNWREKWFGFGAQQDWKIWGSCLQEHLVGMPEVQDRSKGWRKRFRIVYKRVTVGTLEMGNKRLYQNPWGMIV